MFRGHCFEWCGGRLFGGGGRRRRHGGAGFVCSRGGKSCIDVGCGRTGRRGDGVEGKGCGRKVGLGGGRSIMMAMVGFWGFGRGKIVVELLFCRGTVLEIDGGGVHGIH